MDRMHIWDGGRSILKEALCCSLIERSLVRQVWDTWWIWFVVKSLLFLGDGVVRSIVWRIKVILLHEGVIILEFRLHTSSLWLFSRGQSACSAGIVTFPDLNVSLKLLVCPRRVIVLAECLIILIGIALYQLLWLRSLILLAKRVILLITAKLLNILLGPFVMWDYLVYLILLEHGDHFTTVVALISVIFHFVHWTWSIIGSCSWVLLVDLDYLRLLLDSSIWCRIKSTLHVHT